MKHKEPFFIRNIEWILVIILLIKIASYFSVTEVRIIRQFFKVISRVGMTVSILLILIRLRTLGCVNTWRLKNSLNVFLYILYLGLGFVSFTWSTDPSYSALQWFMTFESFVFVFIFFKVICTLNQYFSHHQINLIDIFIKSTFPILLTFAIGSFAFPDIFYREMRGGDEIRLGGWIMNPNELGMLASLNGALAYVMLTKGEKVEKIFPLISIAVAIAILFLTASRSSLIGFVIIIGILILRSNSKKLKVTMILGMLILVPLAIRFIIFKNEGGISEVLSMTGRIPFWTALLNEGIVKEPFFGYGFMRINYIDHFQGLNTYAGNMTHNTFLQVLMNLGFVGFFIALFQVILTIKNYLKNKRTVYGDFFIALFIPVMINSFTEFGIFGDANYGILFWQFLIFLFVFEKRHFLTSIERLKVKKFNKNFPHNDPNMGIKQPK